MTKEETFLDEHPNIGAYNTAEEREEYTKDEVVLLLKKYSAQENATLTSEVERVKKERDSWSKKNLRLLDVIESQIKEIEILKQKVERLKANRRC